MKSPVHSFQEAKKELISRFIQGKEPDFLNTSAEILDDYFRERFASSAVGPEMHLEKNPCAFLALGGFGRREQCLHSDVDVLLLFRKSVPDQAGALVQEMFYPLWDMGLEVGYAVRSLKECAKLALQDYEILTSQMDARFLCGISSLYSEFNAEIRDKVLRKQGRSLIQWLAEENQKRHIRFGDSSYLLEPNLKEGLGGLRDYHTMLWMARAKYQIKDIQGLADSGHLSPEELETLSDALSFIWTVRNRLHHMTGRKCDQLYFEYQIEVAQAMGFKDRDGQHDVEQFLGTMHGRMESLKQLHLTFVDKMVPPRRRLVRVRKPLRLRTSGLKIVKGTLSFESPESILENPQLLIRIFEKSATLQLPLSIEAKRLVQKSLGLIDDDYRTSSIVVQSLRQIMLAPPHTFNVLNEMFNTGIMVALIPELQGTVNRIQYDQYHLYPVHKHSLRTVQILKSWNHPDVEPGDTPYSTRYQQLVNPEPLLWAALFHDVGKGYPGQNHAAQGAEVTGTALKRIGFHDQDIALISFLVREHLFLFKSATQRDISDEKIIVQGARRFKDADELTMLHLLTVADAQATGPKAWTDWTAALLEELYTRTSHILGDKELATPASTDIVARKKAEMVRKAASGSPEEWERLFEQMPPRYLLYTPSGEILKHVELVRALGQAPFILQPQTDFGTDYRTVTVCAQDRPGLFSKIAGVFTLNSLDILNAHIYTWRNGIALDIFAVKAPPDALHEEETWARVRDNLHSALTGSLDLDTVLGKKLSARKSTNRTALTRPDKIVVDNKASDFYTIIEVYTHDSPGLLYKLTHALFLCDLDLRIAKIATKVDQAVDILYVQDMVGQKADSSDKEETIKAAIEGILKD